MLTFQTCGCAVHDDIAMVPSFVAGVYNLLSSLTLDTTTLHCNRLTLACNASLFTGYLWGQSV
jgi:hypothetical protein